MSCYPAVQEVTSICADYLVGDAGIEPATPPVKGGSIDRGAENWSVKIFIASGFGQRLPVA